MRRKRLPIWKKIILIVVCVVLIIVLLFILLLAVLTFTEYKPADTEKLDITGTAAAQEVTPGDEISVLTWNIGYGALGSNADFFMDGGDGVRTADQDRVNENMQGMLAELGEVDPDIAFFQEVDVDSSRSYHIDEAQMLADTLGTITTYATNYRSLFIPYPLPPIGKVDAGILTSSKYQVTDSTRVQLPCPFSWPLRLGNLKRCLMVDRVPVAGSDKELVIINLHLEAYDDGEGKAAQTKVLEDLLEAEQEKGNYVIAGGDFNQTFSNVDISMYPTQEGKWEAGLLDVGEFSDAWQFMMNNDVPSCRSLDQPLDDADKDSFQYYVIDGFIVSDNITIKECKTEDLEFVNTDHNPVVMKIELD